MVHAKIVKGGPPATQFFYGKKKKFFDDLSNSVRPFDYVVKAGQPARKKFSPG